MSALGDAIDATTARACAAALLLECPDAHPDGLVYTAKQLGEYFSVEGDSIRQVKHRMGKNLVWRAQTIGLFKTGFYAWPPAKAATPAAEELPDVPEETEPDARHAGAWREARDRTRCGENPGDVAGDVASRWGVPFSRTKAYAAKKPGSVTPQRPGGSPPLGKELEGALSTMVKQLNERWLRLLPRAARAAREVLQSAAVIVCAMACNPALCIWTHTIMIVNILKHFAKKKFIQSSAGPCHNGSRMPQNVRVIEGRFLRAQIRCARKAGTRRPIPKAWGMAQHVWCPHGWSRP